MTATPAAGREVRFVVYGTAAPKGSPNRWRVKRRDGREVTVLSEPQSVKAWQRLVADQAQRHALDATMSGPVSVRLRFILPLPKSAPKRRRIWPTGKTRDLDKLCRTVLDSLTGPILADDGVVVDLHAHKDYGDPPRVEITVREVM